MTKKELTASEAQARLEELCVRAERCEYELREKLRRWGVSASEASTILQNLVKHKFVNDTRFTAAYVHDKITFARWGKRKVYQGLLQKRIAPDIIRDALQAVDKDQYTSNLRDFFKGKIKERPELKESYEGRTKLFRYAISRGYEPSLASEMLRSLLQG